MLIRPNPPLVRHLNVTDGSKAGRLPCSVCELNTLRRSGWFLVAENCWFDRLRIFRWNPSLAAQQGYKSACCRQHLKALIAFWLDRSNLRFLLEQRPIPIAGARGCANRDTWNTVPPENWQLLGEISVHREPFSSEWTGSPEALEAIVEALLPGGVEKPKAVRFYHLPRLRDSRFALSLAKALVG